MDFSQYQPKSLKDIVKENNEKHYLSEDQSFCLEEIGYFQMSLDEKDAVYEMFMQDELEEDVKADMEKLNDPNIPDTTKNLIRKRLKTTAMAMKQSQSGEQQRQQQSHQNADQNRQQDLQKQQGLSSRLQQLRKQQGRSQSRQASLGTKQVGSTFAKTRGSNFGQ